MQRAWTLLLLVTCSTLLFVVIQSKSQATDQISFLRDFYKATGGPYWRNNTGWNNSSDTNFCRWHGITCLHDSVFELKLPNNNLTGTLPTGVRYLRSLWTLHLDSNNLYGRIPDDYGDMPGLMALLLSNNDFSGPMPEKICGIPTCQTFNNPRLICPSNNCRNNHCNMTQCNCGGLQMCNDDYDCAGKLCAKCKQVGSSPWYKICK